MSSHIWYVLEYSVAFRNGEAFRNLVKRAIEIEHSQGEGVLNYEFFLGEEGSKFYEIVLFRDSEAALSHLERAKPMMPKLLEVAEIARFEIYGNPTTALSEAMASFGARMFGQFAGFTRLIPTQTT